MSPDRTDTDIVKRLRHFQKVFQGTLFGKAYHVFGDELGEAADEIERLRDEIERLNTMSRA
jgi:hypothetical protein